MVDLDETAVRTQGDLCPRHAAALVLPRGWELHDDRSERGPRRVAEPSAPGQRPGFEPVVVASNGHGATDAAVENRDEHDDNASDHLALPRAVPAQFGANDADDVDVDDRALSEILDAQTPLLRRAFRNAKPSE